MPQPLALWRANRLSALMAADGWLNLTDRIEVPAGTQHTVGQGLQNALQISAGPDHLGLLQIDAGGEASLTTPDGTAHRFLPVAGAPPRLVVANLLLEIHVADGRPALRVRQTDHPRRLRDPGLRWFPDAADWVIAAEWQPLAVPRQTTVEMVGGSQEPVRLTHVASFIHAGRRVSLLPTHWKAGAPMFVIRDQTAGETYPAARFLIGEDLTDTRITLDFNKAHTPPCGFTDHAICPLPPPENILPFRIEAGELRPA